MFNFIFSLVLLFISLLLLSALKTINYLPLYEIKKRAKDNDQVAIKVNKFLKFYSQIEFLLILLIIFLVGLSLVVLIKITPFYLGFLAVIFLTILGIFLYKEKPNKLIIKIGLLLLPLFFRFFRFLSIHFKTAFLTKNKIKSPHTGLYDLEDLNFIINQQLSQVDNRMLATDLDRITKIINIENQKITDLIIPVSVFPKIYMSDKVSPVIIDEIYKSKQQNIPIFNKEGLIVGSINKNNLGLDSNGLISDLADKNVFKANINDSIFQVLEKMASSSSANLLVFDETNNFVGMIDIKKIVRYLFNLDDFTDPTEFLLNL